MLATSINRHSIDFDVHGAGVSVTTDDHRAATAIEAFLRPFVADELPESHLQFHISTSTPPPAKDLDAKPVCDLGYFAVTKSGTRRRLRARGFGEGEADLDTGFAQIWSDGWGEGYVWGTTRLIFLPLWAMLLKTTGRFTLHAAGVARNGRALIFPCSSGGGKSCLTMNLVNAGFDLLGDDTQFVIPRGDRIDIAGFNEPIALRRGAFEFFPELKDRPVGEGERVTVDPWKDGLPVAEDFVSPSVIAFPQITHAPRTTYERMSSSEALQRLILASFFFTDQAMLEEHFATLSRLVAESRCYRLGVGTDPSSLIECVERMESES